MARRLTKYHRKKTHPNGKYPSSETSNTTYYHTPPYAFLKKHGRYFLLFHAIASGRLRIETETGRAYRRRSIAKKFRRANLERDKKGYLFLRVYATFTNSHGKPVYYRQAICLQIAVYLIHHQLTDIPPDHFVDHIDDKCDNNAADNLQLLTDAANQQKRLDRYYKLHPELLAASESF